MAIIPLNDEYRIGSDDYCWRLEHRRMARDRKTGELVVEWRPETFHGTLGQAAQCYLQKAARASEAEDIATLQADVERALRTLSQALGECFDADTMARISAKGRELREVSR